MEMLGGCDIRVACPEAKFAVMEPKRGLFAGGGTTVRLPRQVPFPQAMEFLLCADLIPAQRAYEMGLLNAVVPRDQLLETAYEFARRMTANAPLAVQATKQSALQGLYHDEDTTRALRDAVNALAGVLEQVASASGDGDDATASVRSAIEVLQGLGKQLRTPFEKESRISSRIFQTEDAKEGPKAFAEKRKPNWQAR
jgi:enoyl-CoA hydratase